MQLYTNRFEDSKNADFQKNTMKRRPRSTIRSVTLQSKIQKDKKTQTGRHTVPSLMTSQNTTLGAADATGHWELSSPARALVLPATPCVEQKQEPSGMCGINRGGLGARLLGEAKQLDRSFGGYTWYLRGNLSSSHHLPTMPPP